MCERAHRHPCVEKGIHTKDSDRNQAASVTKSIIPSEGATPARSRWIPSCESFATEFLTFRSK
jgi:hypothetical protein